MALSDVPGLGAFIQKSRLNAEAPMLELQQANAAQGLLAQMQERGMADQMRGAIAQSGGDVEGALKAALASGNVRAATALAPLVKLEQERKEREATRSGLAAILQPPAAAEPAMAAEPGAPTAAPAATGPQARIAHLNKLASLYATNPVVVQRIQAEIDKLQATADKAPQKRDRIAGNELVQEEFKDGKWTEIGRGPRFAKQVVNVNTGGGEAPTITDDTLAMDAWRYLTDGTLPPNMGRGVQGSAQATKIRNESARLAKEMGMQPDEIRMAQLTNKTQVQAIGQLAKAKAQILQFEKLANQNADIALEMSDKVWRTGSPLLNTPLQIIRERGLGDVNAKNLSIATETFVSEYAKVMSGGYGAAAPTEGAQARAHKLLNESATQKQFADAVALLKREMRSRETSLNAQMAEERNNLRRGINPRAQDAAPAAPTAAPAAAPTILRFDAKGNPI